ncbi:MAG TPA: hypothetical protein VF490_11095 [Chryseosolibacter sp.]
MNGSEVSALAGEGRFAGKLLHGAIEETHISWVILSDRFAFKIKKPLRLSFLDFSTLPKRKRYCEKEVELNSRFSDIYLDVVPVRNERHMWTIGRGRGKIRDYAVRMKRMDSGKRMDVLLRNGKVTPAHIVALSKSIAAFHTRAKIIQRDTGLSFLRTAFKDIRVIRPFVSRAFSHRFDAVLRKAPSWSDSFLRQHSARLKERVALGYKRDLHGDLHSGNIFLGRKPVLFDCIEFNRHIDVIDEIAFFCMDLEAHGFKKFSRIFLEAYSGFLPPVLTPDDEEIFNYFRCYRANVRAKVHALSAMQESDRRQYRKHLNAVRTYLILMEEYMSGE